MNKKKIFLNGRFLTRPLAGVQRTAFELILALDNLIEQRVVDSGSYAFILIYSGTIINPIELKHIKLQKKGWLTGNLWEQLELPVYTIGNLLISMSSIAPLLKRKQILIVHDASFFVNPEFFSKGFRTWYKFAIPFIARFSRLIITVSDFSKRELVKHGKLREDKITVLYNAADHILRFEEPSSSFKVKIEALKPYCLAVSSLGANKNFAGLSKAINSIDFSNYNMVIAGGQVSTLKYAAGDESVTYLGYVSNAELKYLYGNASLFVFPSFYEGFGIPPLEAMIMGCPVAASNTSSIPEVLGDACAYFSPADPNDIADKIYTLINDKGKLNDLREKGYKQAAKYNWAKSAKQLFECITKYA
jgi:glycosyltransferase involved in cell wall biosynthesis